MQLQHMRLVRRVFFLPDLEEDFLFIYQSKAINMKDFLICCFGNRWCDESFRPQIIKQPGYFAYRKGLFEFSKNIIRTQCSIDHYDLQSIMSEVRIFLKCGVMNCEATSFKNQVKALKLHIDGHIKSLGIQNIIVEDIFGGVDLLFQMGPEETLISNAHEDFNQIHPDIRSIYGPLKDYRKWPHEFLSENCVASNRLAIMYRCEYENENLLAKAFHLERNEDEKLSRGSDHPKREIGTHKFLQNNWMNNQYNFTDNCAFINDIVGVTVGEPNCGLDSINANLYKFEPESHRIIKDKSNTCVISYCDVGESFVNWWTESIGRKYKPMQKKFIRLMEMQNIDEDQWTLHESEFERNVKFYWTQIFLGVYYMHKMGLAHRDIKRDNVIGYKMGDGRMHIKLIDFGCSRWFDPQENNWNCTDSVGTTPYMSYEAYNLHHDPEIKSYDARANDVWSLGIILYKIITNCRRPIPEEPLNSDRGFRTITDGCYLDEEAARKWREEEKPLMYSCTVSEDCRDLLRQIFYHESDRITMDEILEHPFVQSALQNDVDFFEYTLNCKLPLHPNPKFDKFECPSWFSRLDARGQLQVENYIKRFRFLHRRANELMLTVRSELHIEIQLHEAEQVFLWWLQQPQKNATQKRLDRIDKVLTTKIFESSHCEHGLKYFITDCDLWSCSICGSKLSTGKVMYGCRTCDIDICQECFTSENEEMLDDSLPSCFTDLSEEQMLCAMNYINSPHSSRTIVIEISEQLNIDITSARQLVKYFIKNRVPNEEEDQRSVLKELIQNFGYCTRVEYTMMKRFGISLDRITQLYSELAHINQFEILDVVQGCWMTDKGSVCEVRDHMFEVYQDGGGSEGISHEFNVINGKLHFQFGGSRAIGTLNIANDRIIWTSGMTWNRISETNALVCNGIWISNKSKNEMILSNELCYFPKKKKYKVEYRNGKIYLFLKKKNCVGYLHENKNEILWLDGEIWTKTKYAAEEFCNGSWKVGNGKGELVEIVNSTAIWNGSRFELSIENGQVVLNLTSRIQRGTMNSTYDRIVWEDGDIWISKRSKSKPKKKNRFLFWR